jgi:hypothetical protein
VFAGGVKLKYNHCKVNAGALTSKDSRHRAIWRDAGISYSVPFLSQEEIADIPVFDPVSAHVELIEGNNVLREVVADVIIRAELAVDRFVGGDLLASCPHCNEIFDGPDFVHVSAVVMEHIIANHQGANHD